MKRILSLLLILALTVTALGGCSKVLRNKDDYQKYFDACGEAGKRMPDPRRIEGAEYTVSYKADESVFPTYTAALHLTFEEEDAFAACLKDLDSAWPYKSVPELDETGSCVTLTQCVYSFNGHLYRVVDDPDLIAPKNILMTGVDQDARSIWILCFYAPDLDLINDPMGEFLDYHFDFSDPGESAPAKGV